MPSDATYNRAYYKANRERILAHKQAQRRAAGIVERRPAPLEQRFWPRVDRSGNGCWLWLGARDRHGYGRFGISTEHRSMLAHRVSYELVRGPIPPRLSLDHLCRNTSCVNPDHLEPVTQRVNTQRYTSTIDACPRGHAYDEANTYVDPTGGRRCRECTRLLQREARTRQA